MATDRGSKTATLPGAGSWACTADRIFDGERLLSDHAVVVGSGVVSAVVPLDRLPPGMPLWREPGTSILPGLIDTHTHFMRWQGPLFLAWGVTTIRDVGNRLDWILDCRARWESQPWPRLLCTGPLLDGPSPVHEFVARRCTDLSGAVAAVRQTAAAGVDGIKFYVGLERSWLPAMVREAHQAGLRVCRHCAGDGVVQAGESGVDEFFHLDGILSDIWPDHPPGWLNLWGLPEFARTWDRQRQVADRIAGLGMTSTPTLAYWDSQWRARTEGYVESEELRDVPARIRRWQGEYAPDARGADQWRRALEAAQKFVGLLLDRGVPTLAGSDVPCGAVPPGLSLWRELALLVESGMSPPQALQAATAAAGDFLGHPELGRLRPGSPADMVFVKGNPMERIPPRPQITKVLRRGETYELAPLFTAAAAAGPHLQEDPWGMQFERHWSHRTAAERINR